MKLKIGDKVIVKSDTLPDFIGMTGSVIEIYKYDKDFPYNYLVRFDTSECLPIIWDEVVTQRLYKARELEKRRKGKNEEIQEHRKLCRGDSKCHRMMRWKNGSS